ncbi:MAG: hypothetical protein J5746_06500 [Victivallales bacterium]|nr:hypothetical protein [Victivallales bacterium]
MTWQTELREKAKRLNLKGMDLLECCSDSHLAAICNGIGPAWFPEILRDFITKLSPTLHWAADLHDLMYYFGDGTKEDFSRANQALAENGAILAKEAYAWYDPLRYLVMLEARRFAKLCERYGYTAYTKAIQDRIDDTHQ